MLEAQDYTSPQPIQSQETATLQPKSRDYTVLHTKSRDYTVLHTIFCVKGRVTTDDMQQPQDCTSLQIGGL